MYLLTAFIAICIYALYNAFTSFSVTSGVLSHVCAVIAGLCVGVWISSYEVVSAFIYLYTKRKRSKAGPKRGIETLYDDNIILNLVLPSTSWFNMGYWVTPHSDFVSACEAMATLVATSTALTQNDVILDIGCGSGEQDFYFAKVFKCKKNIGY